MTTTRLISSLRPLLWRDALAWCVAAVMVLGTSWVHAADPGSAFDSANKLYAQGKFNEAATNYADIIRSGQASAPVYFNLGNAFFKAGQIGRAILAYRHAKAIAARDPDILANLQFARNQVQGPGLSQTAISRYLGKLSLNEWTLAAAAAVWLCFLLMMLAQWRPAWRTALRGWTFTCAATAVLVCGCLGAQYYRLRVHPTAVIIAADAPLHQAPLAESPSPLALHDGAEVRVLDRKDDWVQVSADNRRIGWIQREQAVVVDSE